MKKSTESIRALDRYGRVENPRDPLPRVPDADRHAARRRGAPAKGGPWRAAGAGEDILRTAVIRRFHPGNASKSESEERKCLS